MQIPNNAGRAGFEGLTKQSYPQDPYLSAGKVSSASHGSTFANITRKDQFKIGSFIQVKVVDCIVSSGEAMCVKPKKGEKDARELQCPKDQSTSGLQIRHDRKKVTGAPNPDSLLLKDGIL